MGHAKVALVGVAFVVVATISTSSCFSGGFTKAAEERAAAVRAPQEAQHPSIFPSEWSGWNDKQRKDWEQRMDRERPAGFFPQGWRDWKDDQRAAWWRDQELAAQPGEGEGIFAIVFPPDWDNLGEAQREQWWCHRIWRHRLKLLEEQEEGGLVLWVFPTPLPPDWDRWNDEQRDEWLGSGVAGIWDSGVLYPLGWNDWTEPRREKWWDDIAGRCGFQAGLIFPTGWDDWRPPQRAEWWDRMRHAGVGYLASALPDDWDRWKEDQRGQWLHDVEAAKEQVSRTERARLSAALGGVESAARRGVPPPDAAEIGHQGLAHGLPPQQFRPLSSFATDRSQRGVRGDDLRQEIGREAVRRGQEETARPEDTRGGREAGGGGRGGGRDDSGGGGGGGGRGR